MRGWWGKLLGALFGFWWVGLPGLLVGFFIGHMLDRAYVRTRSSTVDQVRHHFFQALFQIMGFIAKSDGRVSPEEIEGARKVMQSLNLNEQQRLNAMRLFNEGKQPNFEMGPPLQALRAVCLWRRNILYMFLQLQFQAAHADGLETQQKQDLLSKVSTELGLAHLEFNQLYQMFLAQQGFRSKGFYQRAYQSKSSGFGGHNFGASGQDDLKQAYAILGLPPGTSFEEVTRAYRRLMNRYHPDKLAAQGLPSGMMKSATEKTQTIKSAYELIKARVGK